MSEHAPNDPIAVGDLQAHGHADHALGADAFTDAEWASLRAEDFAAGKAVVILMLSIFSTGVVLYSIVAYIVIS